MSKLPLSLDNPVDNLFVAVASAMEPALKQMGHTPNVLTTYSFGSGVLALVALSKDNIPAFAVLWLLQIFWDCADGHFARRYGMTSKLGDAYDHFTDIATMLALIVLVYRKYDVPPAMLVAFAVVMGINFVHLGCQQKHLKSPSRELLDTLQPACPDTSLLRWTRYLSHGTMHVLIVLGVVLFDARYKKKGAA